MENERRRKNAEQIKARARELYAENRDRVLARKAKWRAENADQIRERDRLRRSADRERAREKARRDARARRATVKGRLENTIRAGIAAEIKSGTKRGRKTFDALGYSVDDLKRHLEAQFLPGMSWENYGVHGWHIDHRVPLASFHYESMDDPEFRAAWALSNLQPLWADTNRSKGARRTVLL